MSEPRVSVITICYNATKLLPMTIESVLAQDYSDFEYIIEDGASTDDTASVVKSYAQAFLEKGIEYKYICKKDGGIYDAMNKGVEASSGKWINFMNAGDCFYSGSVLSNVFDGREYEEGIVYGDCVEYEYGRFYRFRKCMELIEERMPFSHQSAFASAKLLREHPFEISYRYSADYDLLLTAYQCGLRFTDSGEVICITTKDGVSSVNYHDMLIESSNILKAHGLYHHTEEELIKIEKELTVKQFVLDHFPAFIKKAIRGRQIKARGQEMEVKVPKWYRGE